MRSTINQLFICILLLAFSSPTLAVNQPIYSLGNGGSVIRIAGDGIGGRCLSPLPIPFTFSWVATGSYYSTNYTENTTNFTAIVWTNGTGTFAPNGSVTAQVLVVAGGGGSSTWGGGGGGGGAGSDTDGRPGDQLVAVAES